MNEKKTSLFQKHVDLGARMVPFAGFSMPVQYSGLTLEHMAVRKAAGLFDVSHMGNILVSGPKSLEYLQKITVGDVSKLPILGVQYSAVCRENGCPIDDILVTYLEPNAYHLVVNASNVDRVWEWMQQHVMDGVSLQNQTERLAILALQGPKALAIAQKIAKDDLSKVERYHAGHGEIAGIHMVYSRTGYTGEDGFEFFPKSENAELVWDALMQAGASDGLIPCGLGARDSLRLEAGYSLYGHEIDDQTNLVESGLSWIIGWDKAGFIGRDALVACKKSGDAKKLVGLCMEEKAIPRQGYDLYIGDERIGKITSGTMSPVLDKGIAMAIVSSKVPMGGKIDVMIRDQRKKAIVTSRTFYSFAKGVV